MNALWSHHDVSWGISGEVSEHNMDALGVYWGVVVAYG